MNQKPEAAGQFRSAARSAAAPKALPGWRRRRCLAGAVGAAWLATRRPPAGARRQAAPQVARVATEVAGAPRRRAAAPRRSILHIESQAFKYSTFEQYAIQPDWWPSGKAADCRSADPEFESRSVLFIGDPCLFFCCCSSWPFFVDFLIPLPEPTPFSGPFLPVARRSGARSLCLFPCSADRPVRPALRCPGSLLLSGAATRVLSCAAPPPASLSPWWCPRLESTRFRSVRLARDSDSSARSGTE